MIRVMDAGYLLKPVYCNGFQSARDCSFWPKYIDYCKHSGVDELRLLVTCDGLGITPSIHVVGVCMNFPVGEIRITVADPVRGDLKTFNQDEFQRAQYALKTVEVLRLDSSVLEDYPPVPPTP